VGHGGGMILHRSKWPEATRDFLEGRREVRESAIAYEALRWPPYHPLTTDVMTWLHAALKGIGWTRRPGSPVWLRPAR
jgi:hypothetical protein